ncbi:hypothetical protein INT45_008987 [Circinella minor]|uniref:ATP synthase subunit g n=1 Tax=Circinella minor TaxID=1195481 RepID=A0A8H7S5W4_9FUNG|nr:hypothetical protein INT45_008987 [Circinella minor]
MSAKIVGSLQSTLSKLNALQKPVVYNTKVAVEIAKQVYTKEGMAVPTGEQFAQAQQTLQKSFNMSTLKNLTIRDVAKGGIVAAELYTFFLVGEIVGRRNLIGYDVEPAVEHHEH